MNKVILILMFLSLCLSANGQADISGLWKTIDDVTGEAKSHVEIIKKEDNKYYGTVMKLLLEPEDTKCTNCKGEKKGQKIKGMQILKDLQVYKDYWSYGKILDPENGKEYKCSIWMEGNDTLVLRGYIGISALGRSQKWHRVE